MKPLPLLASTLILAPVSLAQISYHTSGNEFRRVDHQTNIATVLKGLPAGITGLNALHMTSMTAGFITTVTAPTNVYAISVAGNNVTVGNGGKPLNTDATAGGNIAQVVPLLGFLYFITQKGAAGGVLQRIPVAGGKVQQRLDLSKLTIPAAATLANACTKVGLKVYVCTFASGSAAVANNVVVEHNPLTAAGNGKVIMTLPLSKYQTSATTTYGIGSVNAHEQMVGGKPHLTIYGVFGDVVVIDVSVSPAKVVSHLFSGRRTSKTATANNLINSGFYDASTGDHVLGSRTNSAVERMAGNHTADQMIAKPTGAGNGSVSGTWYFPAKGNDDMTVGNAGKTFSDCAATNGHRITDAAMGAAVGGNKNFAFALYNGTGTDVAFLALGVSAPAFTLLGCDLHLTPIVVIGTKLTAGRVTIPAAIPAGAKVKDLYRQWASGGAGPFVLSNVRRTNIK